MWTRTAGIRMLACMVMSMVLFSPAALGLGEPRFVRLPFTGGSGGSNDNLAAIRATIKDSRGFIWLGGENGLARFDGYELVIHQTDPNDPKSLSANFVWALAIDHDGVLWVATGRGLNRYNASTETFDRFLHDPHARNSISNNNINALAVDADNNLIIGTNYGLSILNPARTHFDNHYVDTGKASRGTENIIRDVYVDSKNRIWLGTSERGLQLFHRTSGRFTGFMHNPQDPGSLVDNDVSAIEEDSQGRLWVGTYSRGLSRMNADGQTFTHYVYSPTNPATLGSNNVGDLLEDSQKQLWVATDHGGLALYVPETDSFRRFTHQPYNPNSLSTNQPRHLYEDNQGNLWIGMFPTGVNLLDGSASVFKNYFHKPNDDNSLSDSGVLCFFEDSEGIMWIGTENGLNALDRESGRFTRYAANPQDKHALRFGAVLTIEEDVNGDLWVGTWSGGAHRFDKATGRFHNYFPDPSNPGSINNEFVWKILRDSDNDLWFATETGGLNRYVRETDSFVHYKADARNPNAIISNQLWNLMEDSRGYLWVATLEGLDRFDKKTGEFTHFLHDPADDMSINSEQIIALYEHSRGDIWVGTRDAGLNIFDPQTETFSAIGVKDGLPSAQVSSIIEDDDGFIWVTTVNGIARIDPDTRKVSVFNRAHGLVANNFNRDASWKDQEGQLYIGGIGGFSVFDPQMLASESEPPPMVITDFRLFNRPVAIGGPRGLLSRSVVDTEKLTLNYSDSMFSFEFAALNYRAPSTNRYIYKLEGFDQDWVDIGHQRTATYTNLNPGHYTFRVKAANRDGVWSEDGASIALEITPPPWQSWWAYSSYGLFLFGVLYMSNKYKSLRIKSDIYKALSAKDPLTGIANRTGIAQAAADVFSSRRESKGVGFLVMDIDHFKKINDERGHDAGDRILKEFAAVISNTIRAGDSFARWGGEEFVLLCSDISRDAMVGLAEKLRGVIAAHEFESGSSPLQLSMSVGVAYAVPGDNLDKLFKRADVALYEAKAQGRNRIVCRA
jgi:diguanylate cyclase (GGDEF)-like protein